LGQVISDPPWKTGYTKETPGRRAWMPFCEELHNADVEAVVVVAG
jgi:hypothetical protein